MEDLLMITSGSLLNLFPFLLVALIVYKARIIKPIHNLNTENYLSIDTCQSYRGIFAIVVVFHHLAQRTECGGVFYFFTKVGYLAVAVFFFLVMDFKNHIYQNLMIIERISLLGEYPLSFSRI
jgi:hypothetical protein